MMITEPLTKAFSKMQTWRKASLHRRELKNLSNHLLEDIGLSRIDSGREVKHLLWDLRKEDNSSTRQENYPAVAFHVKICVFGKCLQY